MNSTHPEIIRICEDVKQEMAAKVKANSEIEWTVDAETLFFYALMGRKPVGVNRHFMMLFIQKKFSEFINKDISSKVLWDHLDTMYDMAALHESEIIPFPNDEVDFELPEDCHELVRTKYGITLKKSNNENESNKDSYNSPKSSKKLTPKLKQGLTVGMTAKKSFTSPTFSKPVKNQNSVKTETKTPNSEAVPKSKELGLSAKYNKVKCSSSPSTHKIIKSETTVKEDSNDFSVNKKYNKFERGNSPAILKKLVKTEPIPINSSSKKYIKSESSVIGIKPIRPDISDNYTKRDKKIDKYMHKKVKTSSSAEVYTKKHKVEVTSSKKRTESESSSRKSSESSVKNGRGDIKYSSHSNRETETSTPGSRKSSPGVKLKVSESSKKLKSLRVEEPSKKLTPPSKRRRQ